MMVITVDQLTYYPDLCSDHQGILDITVVRCPEEKTELSAGSSEQQFAPTPFVDSDFDEEIREELEHYFGLPVTAATSR